MRTVVFWTLFVLPAILLAQQPEPIRPDPKLTPGATFDVTLQDISTPGYSKTVRAVTTATRREAFREYGISNPDLDDYEIDHLIPAVSWRIQLDQEPLARVISDGFKRPR